MRRIPVRRGACRSVAPYLRHAHSCTAVSIVLQCYKICFPKESLAWIIAYILPIDDRAHPAPKRQVQRVLRAVFQGVCYHIKRFSKHKSSASIDYFTWERIMVGDHGSVPKELWHRILKSFEESLMKVARSVCKQWNRLVTPAVV